MPWGGREDYVMVLGGEGCWYCGMIPRDGTEVWYQGPVLGGSTRGWCSCMVEGAGTAA